MSEYIYATDEHEGHWLTGEEIVRCRDCDFSHENALGNLSCCGPLTEPWDYYNDEPNDGVKVEPDGFCAWGEKRGE